MPYNDNRNLTPGRARLALLALALGGFGIGATEFIALGLLPELAHGLLPEISSSEAALAKAGWLVSAYALGVVIGAPTLGLVAAKWPRRRTLVTLLVVAAAATIASALAPAFEVVLVARFLSALPHGAYFGVASVVAASLLGPSKRAGAIAFVLSGLTVATVIGVPLLTSLGHEAGWRWAFAAVAGIFTLSAVAVSVAVPEQAGDRRATARASLQVFRRGILWVLLGTGAIGFGGFFAVYSYVSTFTTEVAHLSDGWVPISLAVLGSGMFIGNFLGGWLSDRSVKQALYSGFGALIVSLVLVICFARTIEGLLLSLFLVGLTAMSLSPTMQARLLDVMTDSPALAGALNQSAINLGNGLGAFLGGTVIAGGFGYVAPAWVGIGLGLAGVLLAAAGFHLETKKLPGSAWERGREEADRRQHNRV